MGSPDRSARPRGHYFDEDPAVPSRQAEIRLDLPDASMTLTTDRGVFAHETVDAGTKVLLVETADAAVAPGPLLDLGCGYGPIAVTLARRFATATVWAVDVNRRARELTASNAAANGVGDRVRVASPGEVPGDLRFAGIWSNPPARIGKEVLHELLITWLERLQAEGRAWLVVHKHLGSDSLARWLAGQQYAVTREASRQGYRVLCVQPKPEARSIRQGERHDER